MVSVICCAYNQEKYIEDALKGFIIQKTSFAFEVLVSDDASTDSTAEIIRRYEKEYPDLIKPLYLTENQYSKGIYPGALLLKQAKGRYIAFCEGDDYWISEDKLQRQFEALEAHPECDMCAHTALMVRASDQKTIGLIEPRKDDGVLTREEVIVGGGNYLATNSLFYRVTLQREPVRFAAKYNFDYAMQMHGAMRGGILFLHKTMSAYRRGADNSWTLNMEKHQDKMIRHIHVMIDMLQMVDEDTEHRFSESIAQSRRKYEFQLAGIERDVKRVYSQAFTDLRKAMPFKNQVTLFLKCFAPWTLRLWQKARGHK